MPCNASPTIPYIVGALTAILAAIVAHIFSLWRESKNREELAKAAKAERKRVFLNRMGAWRTRVYRCNDISTIISNFPNEVAAFGGDYIAFEQDLPVPDRDKFHSMCDQIVTMTNAEVEEQIHGVMNGLIGKERLLKRIEEIIAFTQTG